MKKKVIIIGAGTIGLHCAFYLKQDRYDVEILEALPECDETNCSYVNCGFIVPSHFIPLASPAMLRSGFKMLFDPKSAFYLPPASNLKNIPWFLNFILAANQKKTERVAPLLLSLNETSRKLYSGIADTWHPGADYAQKGLLMACTTQKGFDEEIAIAQIANRLGISTHILDRQDLKKAEPDLDFHLMGAVRYESDAQIYPEKYMRWLKKWLTEQEVIIRYQEKVKYFLHLNGKVTDVQTEKGLFHADEFVVASGVQSATLARMADINLPVIPGKGYSIDFPAAGNKLRIPLILTEAKVAVSPYEERIRLGSGMEFNGKIGQTRKRRVQAVLDRTKAALPFLRTPELHEVQLMEGIRPLSPDGIPFIGRTSQYQNLSFAAGHAMMGMSLGPVSGKIICDILSGRDPGFDLTLLHPDRYNSYK